MTRLKIERHKGKQIELIKPTPKPNRTKFITLSYDVEDNTLIEANILLRHYINTL